MKILHELQALHIGEVTAWANIYTPLTTRGMSAIAVVPAVHHKTTMAHRAPLHRLTFIMGNIASAATIAMGSLCCNFGDAYAHISGLLNTIWTNHSRGNFTVARGFGTDRNNEANGQDNNGHHYGKNFSKSFFHDFTSFSRMSSK